MKGKMSKSKLVAKAKEKMTEQEYFESREFYDHLVEMFKFMTRCEKKANILIQDMGNGMTAGTDGMSVFLNWNSSIQKKFPTFKLKVLSVIGMFYHEVGHMLYTDFDTINYYVNRIKNDGIFDTGVASMLQQEKEDVEYFLQLKPEYKRYVYLVYRNILNIIDDIWMENKICQEFQGTIKNAITINRIRIAEDKPTLKRMIDDERGDASIVSNLILCYASSGLIPNPHNLHTEHIDVLNLAKPYVDAGISANEVWGRINAATNVFLCMWQIIKDEIEEKEEEEQEQNDTGSGNEGDENGANDKKQNGQQQSETRNNVAEQLSQKVQRETEKSSNDEEEASTSQFYRGKKAEKSSSEETENNSESTEKSLELTENGNADEEETEAKLENEIGGNDLRETIQEKLKNAPRFAETSGSSDGDLNQGGTIEYVESEFCTNDGIGLKVEKTINACAEEIVNRQLLEESEKELVQEVADVPFTNNHKGVNFRINRHKNVYPDDIEEYNNMKDVLKYSRALQKALEETLKRKPTEISRRQWIGKGLDKNNLYDRQHKVFYKKNIKSETNLAVSILIDESGSMSGRKIVEAVRMAVILEDFCRNFNIPLSIAGHNWYDCVEYDIYKDFDEIDSNDKYRLMQISSKSCNRDGAALQFCGEHLLKRPEETKLLILISDGQPNADNYGGERAKEDLKAIKKNLKSRGVDLFAAAIDEDKQYIKAIYGDGFLDMSDLRKLPKTMVRLIESRMNI